MIKILSIFTFSVFLVVFVTLGYSTKIYVQSENSYNRNLIEIGDLIYSTNNGNITNLKILEDNSQLIKELSFVEKGKINDTIQVTNNGTYINTFIPNDTIRGEGKGIIARDDTGEIATWHAYDSGKISDSNESQIYHGIIFFKSPSGTLSFLDNKVGLYIIEIESDDGKYNRLIWNWK